MVNDNFYRSSGVAITIRRITELLDSTNFFFAGCGSQQLQEDLTWMPADRYECFQLKVKNPVRLFKELWRFKRWLRTHQCDLVHCHHRRLAALLRLAGVPVLYTGHLVFPYAFWFHLLRPKWMTAVSPSVASNLLIGTGRPVLKCIGNPISFPDAPPLSTPKKATNRAICIARLDGMKGHKHLLAAWKILHNRGYDVHLDLVGEGALQGDLKLQSQQDGTESMIHFYGFSAEVVNLVEKCLFAILVSEYEGQGLATLESAAQGRPSLLTAVPGSIDLLPPGRTLPNGLGYADVKGLADALEFWFTHPDQVTEEGKRFFFFLRDTSNPRVIAQNYLDVYKYCLNDS